ncbi:MAG: hypothetical protein ICV67_04705 [Thermoleophilia bacterium]|nr:hypothetical protein [Thermoleophilia bacterium]
MSVPAGHLGAATAGAGLLALGFGAIALLIGAATGRRGLAIGATASGAVAAYVVSSLAVLVDVLEPLRVASPYYHYAASDALRGGLAPGHTAFLALLAAGSALLAPAAFGRRDLRV